jgi:hypothetical protein
MWIEVVDASETYRGDGTFVVKPKHEVEGIEPQSMIVDERSISREHPTSDCGCKHHGGDCEEYVPSTSEILGLGYEE